MPWHNHIAALPLAVQLSVRRTVQVLQRHTVSMPAVVPDCMRAGRRSTVPAEAAGCASEAEPGRRRAASAGTDRSTTSGTGQPAGRERPAVNPVSEGFRGLQN